jgi:tetratricopeptide (TPR) repeat protein
MLFGMRPLVVVAVAAVALGCAGPRTSARVPEVLRDLPPRQDPPLDLADDDDLGRARVLYDALPPADPARAARRRALVSAYVRGLDEKDAETAFTRFLDAASLWDARELADPSRPAADLALLAPPAEALLKRASTSGADIEAITALVVLRAAHPERGAELDRTFQDILAYANDLAVAESGPGAERSRVILALETATRAFPSRWATDRLVELYLERQAVVASILAKEGPRGLVSAHRDHGVLRPVWNLVRAHARARRLADAAPVVDRLAGQQGDDPDLRRRLAAALTATDGRAWLALMARFIPMDGLDGDAGAALLVCEEGAGRLASAVEPRKCAAELARILERPGLAARWSREALRLAPDDREVAEIHARLLLVQLGDHLQSERLQAARAVVAEAEAFHARAGERLRGKPLETTLADVLLTFGRGLYTLGELDEAITVLERARRLEDTPDALEELASIALKTGRHVDAMRGFELAAAAPRPTPLETVFDGNRLRRLAGEAAVLAGERAKADAHWNLATASWREALSATLPPRARAQAYAELGRLHHHLGEIDRSLEAWSAAIDADPEQPAMYGDAIAFLSARGHLPEALDAYHRAMGRPEVTEYLRAYTSLWIVDLARLRGATPDRAATTFLDELARGDRWYQLLARFKLGKMTFAELRARADTRGKRAEAYFYEGMARYAAGDRASGDRMMGQVLETRMLGFFEYDMARYFLHSGPPLAVTASRK